MRRFSYDDLESLATDSEHKEHLLKMLIAFDEFCRKNGLTYYLSGGTLLGAIRHQGFIPWDDDIDVNMPRPDCEKLMELSGGKIGEYTLMLPNYTDEYHAYHWKLYDESMLVGKRKKGGVGKKIYPIFIDIFPIEGLPNTEEENIKHYKKIISRKKPAWFLWGARVYNGHAIIKVALKIMAFFLERFVGIEKLFNNVIKVATTLSYEQSDYVGVMMTNVHTTEERVLKEEYAPVIEVDFEGRKFMAPAGYDTYLRQLYGEKYMEWLPVHQRVGKHDYVVFNAIKQEK